MKHNLTHGRYDNHIDDEVLQKLLRNAAKEDKEKVKESVKESKDFILRGQKRIMEKARGQTFSGFINERQKGIAFKEF